MLSNTLNIFCRYVNTLITIKQIVCLHSSVYVLSHFVFLIFIGKKALQRMRNGNDNCFAMFMVVAEVINLSLDWKFSNEVMNTSEPLNDNIKQFSWWLSSWGNLVCLLTLLSLCCDLRRDDDNENLCSLVLSLLSTLIKDIPQTVFVIVVACLTTHLLSWVQILKSLHGIIVPLIRSVKILDDLEQRRRTASDDYKCLKWFERVFCCILSTCSVFLFIVSIWPSDKTILSVIDFLENMYSSILHVPF